MKRMTLMMTLVLAVGMLVASCSTEESEPAAARPPSSATDAPLDTALPSAVVVVTTQTPLPEPEPTEVPAPDLPEDLELITYRTFEELEELVSLPYENVIDLDFSPDHRYLRLRQDPSEGSYNDVFLDLETGEQVFSLQGEQRIYFSPTSVSIAALDGKSLTVYDLETGEMKLQYNSRYEIAALSPDGRTIIEIEAVEEGSGTTFRIVDLTTEEEKNRIFINGELDAASLQFDDEGRLLSGSSFVPPGTYISTVWNLRIGRPIYSIYGFSEIDLHPFGSEIALSNAKQSYISLVSTVTWLQKLFLGPAENGPAFHDVRYSSGGRMIHALKQGEGESTTAYFWYPPSGERLPFPSELDLLAVSISPDNLLIATSQKNGSVIIWGIPE